MLPKHLQDAADAQLVRTSGYDEVPYAAIGAGVGALTLGLGMAWIFRWRSQSTSVAIPSSSGALSFFEPDIGGFAVPVGPDANAILSKMSPGVPGANAPIYRAKAIEYQPIAIALGTKYGVPPALILGMMARESGFGTLLDRNGKGDGGHGHGVLQVDDRSHVAVGGPFSQEHFDQAIDFFVQGWRAVQKKHPDWLPEEQLAGAVGGYNAGPGAMRTRPSSPAGWAAMDRGTAGNNYSRDTWAMAQWYAANMDW